MNTKDLARVGVPHGAPLKIGMDFIVNYIAGGGDPSRLEEEITAIIVNPAAYLGDPEREIFARALYEPAFKQRETLAPWRQWGSGLEAEAPIRRPADPLPHRPHKRCRQRRKPQRI